MDSIDHIELIKSHLPKYLTPAKETKLLNDIIEEFPFSRNAEKIYDFNPEYEEFMQGDVLIDIPFAPFVQGEFRTVYHQGVIVSNTCDISKQNDREINKKNVIFCTVLPLVKFIEELKLSNISDERIKSFTANLKKNQFTNLFYLPEFVFKDSRIIEESFVRFDYTSCISSEIFNLKWSSASYNTKGDRIISLSLYGFYLFIIKLSIHFCRLGEGLSRK